MKKLLMVFIFASSAMSLYAEDDVLSDYREKDKVAYSGQSGSSQDVNRLLGQGLEQNSQQIESRANTMSLDERNTIFNQNKKDATIPFLVNFVAGFGIGSFIQGDTTGGIISLLGDLGSFGLVIGGEVMMISGASGFYASSFSPGIVLLVGGIGAMLGFRVFELVRPWTFAQNYNRKLGESLKLSIVVRPYMNVAESLGTTYGAGITAYF